MIAHLGNIAYRMKNTKLHYDWDEEQFVDNAEQTATCAGNTAPSTPCRTRSER